WPARLDDPARVTTATEGAIKPDPAGTDLKCRNRLVEQHGHMPGRGRVWLGRVLCHITTFGLTARLEDIGELADDGVTFVIDTRLHRLPAVRGPDLERGVHPDHDRLAIDAGVGTQLGRHHDATLTVQRQVGGL